MPTVQEIFDAAVQTHRSGKPEQAAPLYRLILCVDPAHQDALHLYGLTRRHDGSLLQAVAWMARGLRINATLASRHSDLGHALSELGRRAEAVSFFAASLSLQPDQADLALHLGEMQRQVGNPAAAHAADRLAAVLQPDRSEPWYELGVVAYGEASGLANASFEEPIKQFRRATVLRRDHRLAWVNQGIILYIVGELERAIQACHRALLIEPGCDRTLMRLGQAMLALGRVDAARTMLRRACTIAPADREALSNRDRAESYARLSRWVSDPGSPVGLAVRGTFRNTSGYAFMVRQFVRRLDAVGVPLHLQDVPISFLATMDDHQRDSFFEGFDRPVRARALLSFVIPPLAEAVPGLKGLLFSMSETRTVPPSWIRYSLYHDHLIVPTLSSAEAWVRGGFPADRISLCPLGVDTPRPGAVVPRPLRDARGRLFSDYSTRIVNISDFTLRKNLDGLLRVWFEATRADDDAALLLKIGKGTPGEEARIAAYLASVAGSVGKSADMAAPIFVLSGSFSDDEMRSLLAAGTHYWSMSHGEGWDLPMTQAGAMGLTLIAPRHSAYAAYLDDEIALMLPTRPSPGRQPYVGLEWWSPDEVAAVDTIARIVRNGLRPAGSARDRLIREFSWERSGERLVAVLRDLGVL